MMTTNNDLDADRKQGSLTAPQHSDGDAAAITSESIFAAVDTPRGGGNGAGAQQRQQQRLPPASPQPYAKPHFLALDISSALGVVGGGGNGGGGQAAAPMPVTGDSEVTAVDVAAPLPAGGGGGAAAGFFRGKRALDALPKFLGGRGVPLNPLALLTGGDQAAWATQQQPYEGFLIGAMGHTQSVGAALCKGWAECEAPAEPEGKPGSEEKRLVLRCEPPLTLSSLHDMVSWCCRVYRLQGSYRQSGTLIRESGHANQRGLRTRAWTCVRAGACACAWGFTAA